MKAVKENPKISAPKLAADIEIYFKKCIRRVIRKHGYNGRTARRKPYVSPKNRKERINFARVCRNKDFDFWKNVIFTDESKYNVFGSDGKVTVWRKVNQELKKENLQSSVKYDGGSVMVWGCMNASGVGKLHFIEGIMNKWTYLNILKENLHASAEKLGLTNNFIFYQDNDLKHTSGVAREWLLYNCLKVIKTPAQSPDLNVIENLWNELDRRVRRDHISNKTGLKNALMEERSKIDSQYTEKLVRSMPDRLKESRIPYKILASSYLDMYVPFYFPIETLRTA